MTNLVICLLSYVGLSLALTIGNRQTIIGNLRTGENRNILASENLKSFRPSNAVYDWFAHDQRQKPDNMLLLDDVLYAIMGNFYQQKQRHQPGRTVEHITAREAATSQLQNFLYDENADKPERKEKERTVSIAANEARTIFRSGKPYNSASMYLKALVPMKNLARSKFDRTTLKGNLDLQKIQSYRISPSAACDSEAAAVSSTVKSLEKRSHISSSVRQDVKELQKQQESPVTAVIAAGSNMASQFVLRSARGNRQYDVPQIECPLSDDGMERFACPTADRMGRYRCIDDHVLCDGFIDCPMGEDEDRQACMFYKTTKAHLDVLADALLRWARGR